MLPSMEQLLNNALSNLIQNAVEASGPNQTVTIRVLHGTHLRAHRYP